MQMGISSWKWMSPDVAGEVMDQLKWERRASAVFRRVCKGWRDAHDQGVLRLQLNSRDRLNSAKLSRFMLRFQRVKEMDMCGDLNHPIDDECLRALVGLTALIGLNSRYCGRVSDDGLRALAGLTALTSLK
jgi:hypothetical protein